MSRRSGVQLKARAGGRMCTGTRAPELADVFKCLCMEVDKMDKVKRFDWLPSEMPRVAALAKARRLKDGDAHFAECWKRGVLNCEPGWFFAREGALAIGVPGADWSLPAWLEAYLPGTAMLVMKGPEVQHGGA